MEHKSMQHQPEGTQSGTKRPEREGGRVGRKWRRPKANERPKAALEKVEGVGAARLEKYGAAERPLQRTFRAGGVEFFIFLLGHFSDVCKLKEITI
jgi:hypothetical protein